MQSMASPSNSDCQALAACPAPSTSIVDVSIVIPCHNAASTISETFDSLLSQTLAGDKQELVLFNDASSDNTLEVIFSYIQRFLGNGTQVSVIPTAEKECISFQPLNNNEEQFLKLQSEIASKDIGTARGPAFGRNAGVRVSKGTVIAMCDADDISLPERLESQLPLALSNPDAIVGTQWTRLPEDSTPRYREWCNSLTPQQLISQQYRELTLIQPTWMYHRAVFDRISGYKPGSIDDLQFFYDHLRAGGRLLRVDKELVVYRFSPAGVSSQMHRLRILDVRIQNLENALLHKWESFTIWGAFADLLKEKKTVFFSAFFLIFWDFYYS